MEKLDLVDAIPEFHNDQTCQLETHNRSLNQRRIDFILCSTNVLPMIQFCGYLPFHDGLESDHQGSYIDLDIQNIMDNRSYIQPKRKIGSNETSENIVKYQEEVYKQFLSNRSFDRAKELFITSNDNAVNEIYKRRLNILDRQITEIVISVEQKYSTKRSYFQWSPIVKNYALYVRYWKLKCKTTDKADKWSEILEGILEQIQQPFKEDLIKIIPLHSDPKTAYHRAMRLKSKILIEALAQRKEFLYEIEKQRQPTLSKDSFKLQYSLQQQHKNIKASLGKQKSKSLS
jgi:hypothetical protein